MEAILPISAAAKPSTTRTVPAPASLAPSVPSVRLPLAFVLTGLLALCFGVVWLVMQPSLLAAYHYNQYVIAATHLFVLGWICSVVMGAQYQLVPVALETKLYSTRLAWCHWLCHLVGVAGMVWMFHSWNMKQVGHFGCVLALGVALFVLNIAQTLRRVPRWNVTSSAVACALAWIALTVTAGLAVATAKCVYESDLFSAGSVGLLLQGLRSVARFLSHFDAIGTMHAHAHLGGVGCFVMLLVGVSYKLIPMFTLSEIQSRQRAGWSVVLLNAGLAGSFVTILLRSRWKLAFALVVIAALTLYGWELAAILGARKRRSFDWGIRYFLTAVGLLLPLSLLAVGLAWPGLPLNSFTGQLENVYGFLGLLGVVSFAIIGMLYKIIPFLVWFSSYSRQVGRARVPSLADLYSVRVQAAGFWLFLAGLVVTCAAILAQGEVGVRLGCGLLALGLLTLMFNVVAMLSHLFNPKLKSLEARPVTASRSL